MPTFNREFWDTSRAEGERGDLARLILRSSRARVLSDFDRLREYVARCESPETLAALDAWFAEYRQRTGKKK